jgi:hypothetical protein
MEPESETLLPTTAENVWARFCAEMVKRWGLDYKIKLF